MTQGTFTIAVAFLCSTAAATEQEVTCESPCECSSAHGKGRWLVKNDPSSPPTDASAIQSVTPSDIFGWPGPDEGVLSRKEAPMALISCPECNSQVSDRAASCPKCGYPLGQEKSFAHLLVDCRWKARSSAMVVPRVFLAAARGDGCRSVANFATGVHRVDCSLNPRYVPEAMPRRASVVASKTGKSHRDVTLKIKNTPSTSVQASI